MDDNLYDEFGNYIGPELGDSSEEEDSDDEEEEEEEEEEGDGDGEVGQFAVLLGSSGHSTMSHTTCF